MPPDDLLTDDYLAEMVAKEANDCSLKYSSMGLDAYKSTKRPVDQPKPNLRFLNSIVRNTDRHNFALQAKETTQSQLKMHELERTVAQKEKEEEERKRRARPGPRDTRKRMLGNITSILEASAAKRRKTDRIDRRDEAASDRRDRYATKTSDQRHHRSSRREYDAERKGERTELFPGSEDRGRRRDRFERESKRPRSPKDSEQDREKVKEGQLRKHRPHSRYLKHRETEYERRERKHRPHSRHLAKKRSDSPEEDLMTFDSDPLEEIIGPAAPGKPVIRRRGRGANAATSGTERRLAGDYDPNADAFPEAIDSHTGWEDSVEAFRDRQKLKQSGAARMREAGVAEDQIRKWEKGDELDETDVHWGEKSSVRAWDVGKVLLNDGSVEIRPTWADYAKDSEN